MLILALFCLNGIDKRDDALRYDFRKAASLFQERGSQSMFFKNKAKFLNDLIRVEISLIAELIFILTQQPHQTNKRSE